MDSDRVREMMMMMMEMEMGMGSHGGVSILMRLTQRRNYEPMVVALTPKCSWRATVRTHWLNKLRPAGASLKAEGPEGPLAPVVTTGSYKNKNLEHGLATWRTNP